MHKWACSRCTFSVEMNLEDKAIFDAVVDIHIYDHFKNQRPQTAIQHQRPPEIQWSLSDLQFLHECAIEVD